jgi:hypothetical protein
MTRIARVCAITVLRLHMRLMESSTRPASQSAWLWKFKVL